MVRRWAMTLEESTGGGAAAKVCRGITFMGAVLAAVLSEHRLSKRAMARSSLAASFTADPVISLMPPLCHSSEASLCSASSSSVTAAKESSAGNGIFGTPVTNNDGLSDRLRSIAASNFSSSSAVISSSSPPSASADSVSIQLPAPGSEKLVHSVPCVPADVWLIAPSARPAQLAPRSLSSPCAQDCFAEGAGPLPRCPAPRCPAGWAPASHEAAAAVDSSPAQNATPTVVSWAGNAGSGPSHAALAPLASSAAQRSPAPASAHSALCPLASAALRSPSVKPPATHGAAPTAA
mmetsp:Transcript_45467/g.102965  ORF Transcript_45467/g.102965 Transcript_45467/m.102965 type:complete len:293 (-) Transcript_45467:1901-2779(-)